MRPLAAVALALLCACAGGYTPGQVLPSDGNGIPIGGGSVPGGDGGDAGTDGGTDGGADAGDGGCTPLSLHSAGVIDGCGTVSMTGTGDLNITASDAGATGNCTVSLTTTTSTSCSGTASGPSNSFEGACGAFALCTSSSLPGTISCGTCSIVVCDGGC